MSEKLDWVLARMERLSRPKPPPPHYEHREPVDEWYELMRKRHGKDAALRMLELYHRVPEQAGHARAAEYAENRWELENRGDTEYEPPLPYRRLPVRHRPRRQVK